MVDHEIDSALDAQTPIIENMVIGVPPVFTGLTRQLDKLVEQPFLGTRSDFPKGKTATILYTRAVLTQIQHHLRTHGKISRATRDHKLLPTEDTKQNFLRIPWVLLEEQ
jgi:hypothetical protein